MINTLTDRSPRTGKPRFESTLPRDFFSPKTVTAKKPEQTDWRTVAIAAIVASRACLLLTLCVLCSSCATAPKQVIVKHHASWLEEVEADNARMEADTARMEASNARTEADYAKTQREYDESMADLRNQPERYAFPSPESQDSSALRDVADQVRHLKEEVLNASLRNNNL
jgi:hypothetical protein